MKSKVLVSSILTIALCLSLIAGSTFALFTDSAKNDIAVTAGKVDISASITDAMLYSVEAEDASHPAVVWDEYNKGYYYDYKGKISEGATFSNGGTAEINGAVLTLDRVTPGDKISFNVVGSNDSDVAIQYRIKLECLSGYKLMSGLNVYVKGANSNAPYAGLRSYTSAWTYVEPNAAFVDQNFVIELPVWAGNEYQTRTTTMAITVEAVQGNANNDGDVETVEFFDKFAVDYIDNFANELAASKSGETVRLTEDLTGLDYSVVVNGVNLDGQGKTITFDNPATDATNHGIITSGGDIKNITIRGNKNGEYGFRALIINGTVDSDIRVENANLYGTYALNTTTPTGAYALYANDSTFNGWTSYANIAKAVFTDCEFNKHADLAVIRPYVDTEFVDCKFDEEFVITRNAGDPSFTITLDSCYAGGVKVTAENFQTLLADYSDATYTLVNSNVTVIVDGVAVVWN